MRPTTFFKLAAGTLTVLFFTIVFFIAYTGKGPIYFAFLRYVPGGDKTGHTLLMCFLAVVLSWLLAFRRLRLNQQLRIPYGILGVFAFITIEEFVQMLSPNRDFELADLAANYLGLVLAYAAIGRIERFKTRPNPNKR